jgi:biopolymer transport protein ExbD
MRLKKPEDEPFEIMLIPMIDCMLVIIIFFLVATTLKHPTLEFPTLEQQEKELPLTLPESAAALRVEHAPDLLVIAVDGGGNFFVSVDGRIERVTTEILHSVIREAAIANPGQRIRIDGDRDARFEDIIRIVDLCAFEGLHNVGLHTKPDPN